MHWLLCFFLFQWSHILIHECLISIRWHQMFRETFLINAGHYLVSANPSCSPHQSWIGSHCSQNNTGKTPAEQILWEFLTCTHQNNSQHWLVEMKRRCEFASYHFRQSEVRNDGQENNHTGSDEVTEGTGLQLWARWKTQEHFC